MKTHAAMIAAALLLVTGIAGCARTTTGTVARTTEPGADIPGTSQSTGPGTSTDAATISCKSYIRLDEAAKKAIVDEIIKQEGSVLDSGSSDVTKQLADAVCQFLPSSTVKEILVGGPVP